MAPANIPTRVLAVTSQELIPMRRQLIFSTNNLTYKMDDDITSLKSNIQFGKTMPLENHIALQNKFSSTLNMQRKPVGSGVAGDTDVTNRNTLRVGQVREGQNNSAHSNSSCGDTLKKIQQQQTQNKLQHDQNQYLIQSQRPQDEKQTPEIPLAQILQKTQFRNILPNTRVHAKNSDSVRILVLMNGEERFIAVVIPKEGINIEEILEATHVPFSQDTPIYIAEVNSNDLNFVIAIGNIPRLVGLQQVSEEMQIPDSTVYISQNLVDLINVSQTFSSETQPAFNELENPLSPESISENLIDPLTPPKFVAGTSDLGSVCKCSSENLNRCMHYKPNFLGNSELIAATQTGTKEINHRVLLLEKKKAAAAQKKLRVLRSNPIPKKRASKLKVLERDTIVLSSDEEEDSNKGSVATKQSFLENHGASGTISSTSKELTNFGIQKAEILANTIRELTLPVPIKPILAYPQEGRGRITINPEDYMRLGSGQYLNDVIIDFYIKFLVLNLPKEQQEKVHFFSTFFYKRLTTNLLNASRTFQPDVKLTAAEKRHCRVKDWTKSVNIFEKDVIIIPIHEESHWFLAIICYPNMKGTHTMDGKPIIIETRSMKRKGIETAEEMKGKVQPSFIKNNISRPPIKQPCILIFDSLAGANRNRIVTTLRDYLTCEYKAKFKVEKKFTKDVIKGARLKVPQQTNFTDCGLYLLQYVEQFFKDPIKDYSIPILHLKTWFEEIIVTRKREDIALLIQSLMKESGKDLGILPDITFPTLNGELTEQRILENDDRFRGSDDKDKIMRIMLYKNNITECASAKKKFKLWSDP